MLNQDPIHEAEKLVRGAHDEASKYTKPVLKKYPLLFSFLSVFSVAAILHGFELWSDQIPFLHDNPTILILMGVVVLFFTGTLYKTLSNVK